MNIFKYIISLFNKSRSLRAQSPNDEIVRINKSWGWDITPALPHDDNLPWIWLYPNYGSPQYRVVIHQNDLHTSSIITQSMMINNTGGCNLWVDGSPTLYSSLKSSSSSSTISSIPSTDMISEDMDYRGYQWDGSDLSQRLRRTWSKSFPTMDDALTECNQLVSLYGYNLGNLRRTPL